MKPFEAPGYDDQAGARSSQLLGAGLTDAGACPGYENQFSLNAVFRG
jgi:hypothetical protein